MGQARSVVVKIFEGQKRDNGLCHTVNIKRIGTIVEIFGCTVISKKVLYIKFNSTVNMRFKLRCFSATANSLQSA